MKPLKFIIRVLSDCFAPTPFPRPNESRLAFMVCVIKIKVRSRGWQKAVNRVLKSTNGVRQFKLTEGGEVTVSGMVDPTLLMKNLAKSGKSAELQWIQYGQCSSNLFLPPKPPINGFQNQGPFRNFSYSRFALPQHAGYYGLPPPPPPPYAPYSIAEPPPPVLYEPDSRQGHISNCNTM
ncbi:uncharacterized protein LOC129891779 [Solanum dulcamara]|uniref:uncharacterized protein LOC129891779 n=1 Tax=Solanum dulcamara TaxID=45834 RepID=UPI0024850E2E|nr:uncharacterized protein LOC129891779 [Solanum dulcamara]